MRRYKITIDVEFIDEKKPWYRRNSPAVSIFQIIAEEDEIDIRKVLLAIASPKEA